MDANYIIKSLENLTEYEQQQVFNFLRRKVSIWFFVNSN